jgi:hypothetical protein
MLKGGTNGHYELKKLNLAKTFCKGPKRKKIGLKENPFISSGRRFQGGLSPNLEVGSVLWQAAEQQ